MSGVRTNGAAVPDNSVEVSRLLQIPIPRILEALGKGTPDSPVLSQKKRQGFYLSPFHSEKTPSFHYLPDNNLWHDFSTEQSGGVLDLVCLVKGFDRHSGDGRHQALDFLSKAFGGGLSAGFQSVPVVDVKTSGKIVIEQVGPIVPFPVGRKGKIVDLHEYGESRGLSRELLDMYMCQAKYHYANKPEPSYYSLGFVNVDNGYNLMNRTPKGKIKLCTSCAPTFIDSNGRFSIDSTSDSVLVLESAFDWLSLMQLRGWSVPPCDVCVLNSLSNLKVGGLADEYLRRHGDIRVMFDHDVLSRAGQKHTAELISRYSDRKVRDSSGFYADFKDINDYLIELKKSEFSLKNVRGVKR